MSETKLNKRLLRKVRNRIAKIPESYDQDHFHRSDDIAPCGTAACLAGETIIVASPDGLKRLRRMSSDINWSGDYLYADAPVGKRARQLLGITRDDAERFFAGGGEGWPAKFRARFQRAARASSRAKATIAYLDECLKRGKVTW